MKYISFLCLSLLLVVSCSEDPMSEENTMRLSGEEMIYGKYVVGSDKSLIIEPGAVISFAPEAKILAFGNVKMMGTAEEPITLIGLDSINDQWILTVQERDLTLEVEHTTFINGLVTLHNVETSFRHVTFKNDKELEWNSAAVRFWKGTLFADNCTIDWNRKGEGFLVHDIIEPLVQNSTFIKVPDAVEYLGCRDGFIQNCTFLSNSDDAIDLNACTNILISKNEFYGIQNRAMEIGSETFGPSKDIQVINNLMVDCRIGVNFKEASTGNIENATIINSKRGFEIINEENNGLRSEVTISSSVVVDCENPMYKDPVSLIDLENSMSNQDLLAGTNVIKTQISFMDTASQDYRIISETFPEGLDATSIGYQK